MSVQYLSKLPSPGEIKRQYPVSEQVSDCKKKFDMQVSEIFSGRDRRLLLIIGPCSADSMPPVLAYMERLHGLQERVRERIFIIPRVYTNKPRTTGEGYKGMLYSPDPTEKPNLVKGVIAIRKMHLQILCDYGFGTADEMLYPDNYRYLNDLLSYVAVGARSVENQQHRMVASGIAVPVGMKNPTGGDLSVMMNAIHAAQRSHVFSEREWEVESSGNAFAHAIMRGYVDRFGKSYPNYHYEDLLSLSGLYGASALMNPACIVDCNHANSGKKFDEQPRIAIDVLKSKSASAALNSLVRGLMIESYLEDGCAKAGTQAFGQSITDPCLGWEKTEQMVLRLAEETDHAW